MKKALAILLLLTLLLSMAACKVTWNITTDPTETTTAPTETAAEPTETTAEPTETATEPTSEETAAPTEPATGPEVLYRHCRPTGSIYSSELAGFSFTAPEGWRFYTDDQLAEMSGMVGDFLDDETLREQIENSGAVYEMLAVDPVTGNNLNLIVQKVGGKPGLVFSEEEYAAAAAPTVEETLLSSGLEIEFCRTGSLTFLGEEKPCVEVQAVRSGVKISMLQIYRLIGSYVCTLTVTVTGQEAEAGLAAIAEFCSSSFGPYEAEL